MTEAQKKQAVGVVVALLVLAAALLGLKYYNKSANEKAVQAEEEAKIHVVSAEAGDITAFSWKQEENTYTMVREGDAWTCKEYPEYELDGDKVNELLETLVSLEAAQKVEDPEEDASYGFDKPENVLTYSMDSGSVTLTIGMENAITGGNYLKSSGDGVVYLIDSSLLTTFDCDAAALEKEEEESVASEVSDGSEISEVSEVSESSGTSQSSSVSEAE